MLLASQAELAWRQVAATGGGALRLVSWRQLVVPALLAGGMAGLKWVLDLLSGEGGCGRSASAASVAVMPQAQMPTAGRQDWEQACIEQMWGAYAPPAALPAPETAGQLMVEAGRPLLAHSQSQPGSTHLLRRALPQACGVQPMGRRDARVGGSPLVVLQQQQPSECIVSACLAAWVGSSKMLR